MANFIQINRSYQVKSRWEDIARQISQGNDGYLNVGDSVSCTLKNGVEVMFDVLALNPYEPDSVAFGIHDIHWRKPWNDRNTNAGGWHDTKIRQNLNSGEIFNLFPDDLVEMITPRKIVQQINGRTYESLDKFWLLSYSEVFGTNRGAEQTSNVGDIQFDFFKSENNRVKFLDGRPYYHALRSPYAANATSFWFVGSYGGMGNTNASTSYGVCPCFIISKREVY